MGWPVITSYRRAFDEALAEFDACLFFEAHESLETLWMLAAGDEKRLLQGLIQLSVACHHWQKGNQRGASSLLAKSVNKLRPLPDWLDPVILADLSAAQAAIASAQTAGESLPRPSIRIRISSEPKPSGL